MGWASLPFKPAAPGRNARAALTFSSFRPFRCGPAPPAGLPVALRRPPHSGVCVVLKEKCGERCYRNRSRRARVGRRDFRAAGQAQEVPAQCPQGAAWGSRYRGAGRFDPAQGADPEYCRRAGSQGGRDADWQLSRHRWRRPQAGDAAARQAQADQEVRACPLLAGYRERPVRDQSGRERHPDPDAPGRSIRAVRGAFQREGLGARKRLAHGSVCRPLW